MNVGWIGLGRLGLPCAVSAAMQGHEVVGFDIDPQRMSYEPQGYIESGPYEGSAVDFTDWLAIVGDSVDGPRHPEVKGSLRFAADVAEVCRESEVVFLAVQTPHEPRFEGITRLTTERADFDYSWLRQACESIAEYVSPGQTVAVISTVLPGTMRREIAPILGDRCDLVYTPQFIAMGTTMRDYLDPEFCLVGIDPGHSELAIRSFYEHTVPNAPVLMMSIESAELTKVSYNTAIASKIAIANTVMEICHKTPGADVDDVTNAMQLATRRLTSPAYMTGGMGDGGGCHPRDNIAMSWLAGELKLSHNIFDNFMMCREHQAEWTASLIEEQCDRRGLQPAIYGYAYKPNTKITTGSPALLIAEMLRETFGDILMLDPVIDGDIVPTSRHNVPHVWLIGCRHDGIGAVEFAPGSVVIDPFRVVQEWDDLDLISVGRGTKVEA